MDGILCILTGYLLSATMSFLCWCAASEFGNLILLSFLLYCCHSLCVPFYLVQLVCKLTSVLS